MNAGRIVTFHLKTAESIDMWKTNFFLNFLLGRLTLKFYVEKYLFWEQNMMNKVSFDNGRTVLLNTIFEVDQSC